MATHQSAGGKTMRGRGDEAYKEIVDGRNGRPSLLVRMERAEIQISALTLLMRWMAYVATALLITTVVGVCRMVFLYVLNGGK